MFPTQSYLRTSTLESARFISHGSICLKKIGIMFPPLRSGDHLCFFNHLYMFPLIHEPILVQISYFKVDFHPLISVILRYELIFLWQTGYKFCVEFLNLHDRQRFHVREDPPVLLRFCIYHLQILFVEDFPRFLNLSNDHYASCSFDNFKHYTFHTFIACFVLSKLNFHSTTMLAKKINHLFVSAGTSTLVLLPTPLRLLTLANWSSFDSFLEDLSIIFDLTCTNKLHSFWLIALKKFLSINLIYLFIYFMLALGKAPPCCILILGTQFFSLFVLGFLP
ncbi:hypothetical protein AtNW77_Chr4g0276411 [Arabidopsis thaliana]